MHPCTEKDFAKFDPPDEVQSMEIQRLKESKAGLYCLDLSNVYPKIYRSTSTGNREGNLDIKAMACTT